MQLPQDYIEGKPTEKNYERVLFLPRVLQTQELNDLQGILQNQIQRFTQALYRNGEILSGEWSFNDKKLTTKNLVVVLEGFPYRINDSSIDILPEHRFVVCRLNKTVISPNEDPALLDPTDGENYKEAGALRLRVEAKLEGAKDAMETAVFLINKNQAVKIHNTKVSYDRIVDIEHDNPNFKDLPDDSRIFIQGNKFTLSSPLQIVGKNIKVEFSHKISLVIDNPTIAKFFEITGTVKISGVRLILEAKALEDKQKIKIAGIAKDSKLSIYDYTVLGVAPRSYEGEGVFEHNVVWEEAPS